MIRVFKIGRYVVVYVGRICHVLLNVSIKVKKKKIKNNNSSYCGLGLPAVG